MSFIQVQEVFFDQDMALNPSSAATAQLVLAGFTGGTGWHCNLSSPTLSHTAPEGRTHSQLLLCEPYLCMLPAVLSGLCESLKSRCFSVQQKMPENKRGQGKADPVKTCCQSLGCPDPHWLSVLPRIGTLWPSSSKAEDAPPDGKVTMTLRSCPYISMQNSKKFPITLFLLLAKIMTIFTIICCFSAYTTMKLSMAIVSGVYRTVNILKNNSIERK